MAIANDQADLAIPADLPFADKLNGYDAFLFDCDGTLVDTMPMHYRAWIYALKDHGADANLPGWKKFHSLGGMPSEEVARTLSQWCELEEVNVQQMTALKRQRFLDQLDRLDTIPDVAAFATHVAAHTPVAVVSGGHRPAVERSLNLTGLDHLFEVIITPEDVERGKPAPDMYLLAAERLGVKPERCLVFEDGEPGVLAARAAGMDVVIIKTPDTIDE